MPLSKIVANSITDDTITTDQIADDSVHGRRNLIINGAMQVAQRATSATTVSGAGVYNTIDRLKLWENTDGAYTSEQSTEAPDGFSNSIKLAVTTADTSIASNQYSCIAQNIEAQSLQHLAYGTNAAKTITMSFYVRSNKTGTYCVTIDKIDSTTYHYIKEFTINSADTWERKEITIVPDSNIKASGGAIANDNGIGLRCFIGLAWGSNHTGGTDGAWTATTAAFATTNQVNWMDSTSNNFYFTGFQVEVGDKATPYEHRSFDEELLACQRYCQKLDGTHDTGSANTDLGIFHAHVWATNNAYWVHHFSPSMRQGPLLYVSTSIGSMGVWYSGGVTSNPSSFNLQSSNAHRAELSGGLATNLTAGNSCWFRLAAGQHMIWDAEL